MRLRAVTLALLAASAAGCGILLNNPSEPPSGIIGENVVRASARVVAVDQVTRKVTLQRSDGSLLKFTAGDEVRNLAQVKVGDDVNVSYYEALVYDVQKPADAAPGVAVSEGLERAELGDKPGGLARQVTTMTATITALDKSAGTVTLRLPDGETRTIEPRDRRNLDRVSVGDLVTFSFIEALAISVETPD